MLRGILPREAALRRHSLTEYADVARAVRQGDLALFRTALATHEAFFFRKHVYIAVERLYFLVYRRRLKKMCVRRLASRGDRGAMHMLSVRKALPRRHVLAPVTWRWAGRRGFRLRRSLPASSWRASRPRWRTSNVCSCA